MLLTCFGFYVHDFHIYFYARAAKRLYNMHIPQDHRNYFRSVSGHWRIAVGVLGCVCNSVLIKLLKQREKRNNRTTVCGKRANHNHYDDEDDDEDDDNNSVMTNDVLKRNASA